jgi:Vacuolar protein sorting-associated protein 26
MEQLLFFVGESIPIRLFLNGYDLTPTMRDVNKKFSVRYYLNLVLIDDEDRRYFKQQVSCLIHYEPMIASKTGVMLMECESSFMSYFCRCFRQLL